MSYLDELRKSISEMSLDEQMELCREVRNRIPSQRTKSRAAKPKSPDIDLSSMSEEELKAALDMLLDM